MATPSAVSRFGGCSSPRCVPVVVVVVSPRHRHVCLDVAATLWNNKRRYHARRVSAESLGLNPKWIVSQSAE